MPDLDAIRTIMVNAIPFNQVLGVHVVAVTDEAATLVLPDAPAHLNHVGTVHAAAQFGLGEAASGAMLLIAFADLQGQGMIPLAADALIRYRKAARGELRAVATLPIEGRDRIREEVRDTGRARFTIPVKIFDAAGVETTELEVSWALTSPTR
jgi:acyl-coenzyme A thioesterase PaaI-like protein